MNENFISLLESRGVSRRDFLKFCASMAALWGISDTFIPQIAAAVEKAVKKPSVVYLEFARCTGCTESIIKISNPSINQLVLDILSFDYYETIMAPAGDQAEKSLEDTMKEGGFVCLIDGSIPTGEDGIFYQQRGKSAEEKVREVTDKAKAVIAVGTCATYGGIPAAAPNPTEARGVDQVVDKAVINVSGCPPNPEWVVGTVIYYLTYNEIPELDKYGRPKFIYGQTIHERCPRRSFFDEGKFVEVLGSKEEELGYCLYKLGCKGPDTFANCPTQRWNDKINWCIGSGQCIGCTEPDFWDRFAGFYKPLDEVNVAGVRTNSDTIGKVLGGAAAVGIGAHFIGQAATGRLGKGGPKKGGEE